MNYVGKLLGQFKAPCELHHPPEAFCSHLELLYEIENVQWLEKPLSRFAKGLEQFGLTLRNQVAFELELILTQRDNIKKQSAFHFSTRRICLCKMGEALPTHSGVNTAFPTRSGNDVKK